MNKTQNENVKEHSGTDVVAFGTSTGRLVKNIWLSYCLAYPSKNHFDRNAPLRDFAVRASTWLMKRQPNIALTVPAMTHAAPCP